MNYYFSFARLFHALKHIAIGVIFPGYGILLLTLYLKFYQPFQMLFEYLNRNTINDKGGSKANKSAAHAVLIYSLIGTMLVYGLIFI